MKQDPGFALVYNEVENPWSPACSVPSRIAAVADDCTPGHEPELGFSDRQRASPVFLAHSVVGLMTQQKQVLRATSIAMGLTAWLVIMPLAVMSLVTGLVQAPWSAWGPLRHNWVMFKLLLTAVATVVRTAAVLSFLPSRPCAKGCHSRARRDSYC
jgi:hypothetical protein